MDSDPIVCIISSCVSFLFLICLSVAEKALPFVAGITTEENAADLPFYIRRLNADSARTAASVFFLWAAALAGLSICGFHIAGNWFPSSWADSMKAALLLLSIVLLTLLAEISGQLIFNRYYSKAQFFIMACLWGLTLIAKVPVLVFTATGNLLAWLVPSRVDAVKEQEPQTEQDKAGEVQHKQGLSLFQNALAFSRVRARDCMVPRTDIVAIDTDSTIEELRALFVDTKYSKILVYRDTSDEIIGYVHSLDLFKNPKNIMSIMLPVFMLPDTMPAKEAFELFVKQKRSMAIVLDEFGGIAGILTVEDVIEEIFGEIEDEHDTPGLREEKMKDFFLFSGRLEIEYLNEKYHLDLPVSDEYDTLAGLILHHHEGIPAPGIAVEIGHYKLTVTEGTEARIDMVRLAAVPRVEDEEH